MIASDFKEFIAKVADAMQDELNNGKAGQALSKELLKQALTKNPDMTNEEWRKMQRDFMMYSFFQIVKNSPELREEFASHLWRELQSETEQP